MVNVFLTDPEKPSDHSRQICILSFPLRRRRSDRSVSYVAHRPFEQFSLFLPQHFLRDVRDKEYRQEKPVKVEYGMANIFVKGSCRSRDSMVRCRAVQVKLFTSEQNRHFPDSMRVLVLLRKLSLSPETVMVIRGDRLLTGR